MYEALLFMFREPVGAVVSEGVGVRVGEGVGVDDAGADAVVKLQE